MSTFVSGAPVAPVIASDLGLTTTVAAERQRNWSLPTGKDLGRVYGLLMDSFESMTAKVVRKAS